MTDTPPVPELTREQRREARRIAMSCRRILIKHRKRQAAERRRKRRTKS